MNGLGRSVATERNLFSNLPSLGHMTLRDQRTLERRLRHLASEASKKGAIAVAASLVRAIYELDERL